ncbi:TonB-dependent receptor [Deminuibacter soli]|nr:TonB-dependent receptor [Deminuibacter soli]
MNTPKLTACLLGMLCVAAARSQSTRQLRRDTLPAPDTLQAELKEQLQEQIPVISLDDNELKSDGQNQVASLLGAGRDPFYNAASFNFSAAHFRIRGYDGDAFKVLLNGAPVENPDNGLPAYNLFSGLSGVLRNRSLITGLKANAYTAFAMGSTTAIDARASRMQPQTTVQMGIASSNYRYSMSAAYSSGLNSRGWAWAIAGSIRWANEGYVPGTFYHGGSYLLSVDKRLSPHHLFSLAVIGAPVTRARAGAAVAEMQQLAGSVYYNPYWGYQNGVKRSAAISETHRPYVVATHTFTVNAQTELTTAWWYTGGNSSSTGLDWYNAPDPRPDYYRYLPGYIKDEAQQNQLAAALLGNEAMRQINWAELYAVNRTDSTTIHHANGFDTATASGYRSHYILSRNTSHMRQTGFNSTLRTRINEQVELNGGLSYEQQTVRYYKTIADLLGGDFYVDLNQYAEQDFPGNADAIQNDLRHPNRIVHTGDKYGYDYAMQVSKAAGWLQVAATQRHVDWFMAAGFSSTSFGRTGYVTNGLFPYNSYGKSNRYSFSDYALRAGATYKINGRHYVYANGALYTQAPYYNNVFISPATRNTVQQQIAAAKIQSAEAGYILNAPRIRLRLNMYYTRSSNGMDVLSFYHDDYRSFVNYALRNISKLYYGSELGVEAKVLPNVTANAAAAIGKYLYAGRQHATITLDNSTKVLDEQTVYLQNYRIGGSPQQVLCAGITYRSPAYWFAGFTCNYMSDQWLEANPIRRTFAATEDLAYKNTQWHAVVDQQRLQAQYLLNCTAGYSWRLPWQWGFKKPVYLVWFAGINNLLNNKQMVSGGYEQLRFDYTDKNVNKFPPKLLYAYGTTFLLNVSLRF